MEHLIAFTLFVHGIADIGNQTGRVCSCYPMDENSKSECFVSDVPETAKGYKMITVVDKDQKLVDENILLLCVEVGE